MDEHGANRLHPVEVPRAPQPRLAFGPFLLDPESGSLTQAGRPISLAPKPFETLLYLARRAGHVVPKKELMERLWPSTFVTDDVLVQCVVEIRRALGDPAKNPRYLQTLPRRGYRFLGDVRTLQPGDAAPDPDVQSAPLAEALPSLAPAETAGPRRRRIVPAIAASAVLAAIIGGALLQRRKAAAPAPPPAPEPGSVLVVPIQVQEPAAQAEWLRQGLAEMIRAQLGQRPGVHVVAQHRLAAALADLGWDERRAAAGAAAVGVARALQAERLVTGTFLRIEDRFALNAQVVDVPSGRSVGAAAVKGRYPVDLLSAVDDLCLQILRQVGPLRPVDDAQAWRPAGLATRSLDASRAYVEALAAFAQGGRPGAEQAESRLDAALRLDPSFAQAHVKKAEIRNWRRRWGYGSPDPTESVRTAVSLMRDLPERERMLVRGYENLLLRQQPDAALKEWSALLQLYPTYAQESGVPVLVADTLQSQGRWDELIVASEAQVGAASLPDGERARLHALLAQGFRRKGELARALEHADRVLRLWPARSGPEYMKQRAALGRIALEAGRRAEALEVFRSVAAAADADVINLTDAAWGLYMAGEAGAAAALVERAHAADASYGNAYHLGGWLALGRGEHLEAAAELLTAFERTPRTFGNPHQGVVGVDLAALYYAGVAWEKAGDASRARSAWTRLRDHCRSALARPGGAPSHRWQAANFLARASARLGLTADEPPRLPGDDTTYFVQTARLHAVLGRRDQALRELSQGLALGHGELRHIADDPDFESLRGDPEFVRLVVDRLAR